MPEDYKEYSWWVLNCGDIGEVNISDEQMKVLLKSEQSGSRFILLDNVLVNFAFIRGARRKTKRIWNENEAEEFKMLNPELLRFEQVDRKALE